MPLSSSSVISQPKTPAQKRARRRGSFASKQSAKSWEVILRRISDPADSPTALQVTTRLPMVEVNATCLGVCEATPCAIPSACGAEETLTRRSPEGRV
jgi:hypothetical protein